MRSESPLLDFSVAFEFGVLAMPKGKIGGNLPPLVAHSRFDNVDKYKNAILFELAPTGHIRRILRTTPGMSDEGVFLTSDVMTAALYLFPLEKPPAKGGKVTREQKDDRGTPFPVEYEYTKQDSNKLLIKALSVQEPPKPKKGVPETLGIFATSKRTMDAVWDEGTGLPDSLRTNLEQEVKIHEEKLAGASMGVDTIWEGVGPSRFNETDLAHFNSVVNLDAIRAKHKSQNEKRKENKGPSREAIKSLAVAQEELRNIGSMSKEQNDKVFGDLCKVLKKDPALVKQYADMSKQFPSGSRQVNMVAGALAFVGTDAAQEAMVNLYNRPDATIIDKEKILNGFALSPNALVDDAKALLNQVYADGAGTTPLSQQAGFALGASVSKDQDPNTISEFRKALSAASNPDQQSYVLEVMGNDRGPDFQRDISGSISSSNDQVRAAAIDALRFAQNDAGRNMLFSAIQSESNPNVQQVAYRTLQYQPYDQQTLNAAVSCVGGQSNSSVRGVCYDLLLSHMGDPASLAAVRAGASSETNPSLKQRLQGAVNSQNLTH